MDRKTVVVGLVLIAAVVGSLWIAAGTPGVSASFLAQDLQEVQSCIELPITVDGQGVILYSQYCFSTPLPGETETATLIPADTETPVPTDTETATLEPSETPTETMTLEPTVTDTATVEPTPTGVPTETGGYPTHPGWFVVNSDNLWLFEEIPNQYIELVTQMNIMFQDRSVGENISNYLDCLSYPLIQMLPSYCKRPNLETAGWFEGGRAPDPVLDRSNVEYIEDAGEWTAYFAGDHFDRDIYGFQPSYLVVDSANGGGDDIRPEWYTTQLRQLDHIYPGVQIYYTTSLARGIGTEWARQVNEYIRNFAYNVNVPLIDIADIESTAPDGHRCYDNRNGVTYPNDGVELLAICEEYTTEVNGGHLGSHSIGGLRLAQAHWIMWAYIMGWRPDVMPPPTPVITPGATATFDPYPPPATQIPVTPYP